MFRSSNWARGKLHLILNACNYLLLCNSVILLWSWFNYPILIHRCCEIAIAEYYKISYLRSRRPKNIDANEKIGPKSPAADNENNLDSYEHMTGQSGCINAIGSVVGWREDETTFLECLKSMKATECLSTLVVGIDGDTIEDMIMAQCFYEVRLTVPDRCRQISRKAEKLI